MDRLVLALAITGVVVVVAALAARRRPRPPLAPSYAVPVQLDRADFDRAGTPWLVAIFTSASCQTCASMVDKAQPLASENVVVQELEVTRDADLHRRYAIDAVPMVVIADGEGVVRSSFLGPATATDLWATVAELREPGSTPDGCNHGQAPT